MLEPNIQYVDNLLQRISANDEEAYRSLFELYYVPLCLYVKRFIEDKPTQEDIVQDVFFTIWEKRGTIVPTVSAKNYLVTCVKNLSLNHLRKQGYMQDYQTKLTEHAPVYSENLDDLYTLKELQVLLAKTLAKLPPEYRLAFEMSRIEEKSSAEIAEAMGVSVRTVERYRNKATEILKEELKDYLSLLLFLLPVQ